MYKKHSQCVDDHPILLEGLVSIFSQFHGI